MKLKHQVRVNLINKSDITKWFERRDLNQINAEMEIQNWIRGLAVPDKGVIKASRENLIRIGKDAVPTLLETYRKTLDQSFAYEIRKVIVQIGKDAVNELIKALENKSGSTIVHHLLGKIGDPRAVTPLINCFRDKNEQVRAAAVIALGDIRDLRAMPVLIKALKDRVHAVQATAIHALGALQDVRAVPPLIKLLTNRSLALAADQAIFIIATKVAPDFIADLKNRIKLSKRSYMSSRSLTIRCIPILLEVLKDGGVFSSYANYALSFLSTKFTKKNYTEAEYSSTTEELQAHYTTLFGFLKDPSKKRSWVIKCLVELNLTQDQAKQILELTRYPRNRQLVTALAPLTDKCYKVLDKELEAA